MQDFIIVTGGDENYFPLIEELVLSIRDKKGPHEAPVGIIDAGLAPESVAKLTAQYGCEVVAGRWEYDLPAMKVRGREYLRAEIAKPFLDRYFPGYRNIVWIDADAWVQDWIGVELLLAAARRGALGVVSTNSRYNERVANLKWARFGYARVRTILYKNARRSGLPERLCREIGNKPTLNAGIYALAGDAPHWDVWRRHQAEVIGKSRLFTASQLALAMMAYLHGLPYELLPEWCNAMGPWKVDASNHTLVESFLPHYKCGIVHLAGCDEMRKERSVMETLTDLDGNQLSTSLRYFAWRRH